MTKAANGLFAFIKLYYAGCVFIIKGVGEQLISNGRLV
jgi:hypothetical protein